MARADLRIGGSSAIITAAGSGIGRRIATHLTAAGVNTVVNDVDEAALSATADALTDATGDVRVVRGDAGNPSDTERLVQTAVDEFGGLDIVINNLGVAGPTKPCEEVTSEEFLRTLRINLGGAFNTTSEAIPHLRDSEHGRVVNISSISGKRPLRDRTPYTTAKMGIIGFTRTLAVELADDDITVNAVCPGSVEGQRLDEVVEEQARSQDRSVEDVRDELLAEVPLGRFVHPDDIADTVLYLCSDRAGSVTGQDLNVTGGACMY